MSQFFYVHPDNPQARLISQTVAILRDGGVIIYPTDSGYALGGHSGDKTALERICKIRKLDKDHNFTLSGNYDINEDFDEIKVSRGLDVYLTQSDNVSLRVQADENLHDIIMTEVENNVLRIYAEENISFASSRKVMVSFKDIQKIKNLSTKQLEMYFPKKGEKIQYFIQKLDAIRDMSAKEREAGGPGFGEDYFQEK